MSAAPALRAEGISKRYGHVTALQGAELEVRAGEVCALIGDNGAGKSTLVKILSGAETPDTGTIFLDGKAVTMASPSAAQDLGVSTVFQDLALASDLGPTENFYLGRELLKGRLGRLLGITDRKRMAASAREEFSRLGVNLKSMNVPVGSLSGGQRQSIAIARAAAWADKVIILDEPTAALGVVQTDRVLRLVRTVAERGLAVILVTHNMTHVVDVADSVQVLRLGRRVATFERGQSTVEKLVAAMTSDPAAAKEDGEQ
ncbi:ATP-binding cassette domain-containing protein [Mycobacterium sp. 21AC1]|uniref:ATP-binding cassette domain-containing protein n=1 Tax=[Mycobacterium] appelbergii TaxID=2939269 RepID=UPI002938FDE6|nr:ATP-binding cassette domain-containing protein [Mycobacterium sp. 21AC1]MDV3125771.1 ATP-binding cassette domain-containing protein [Mycobacterium sp. 21AC1]